MGQSDFIEFTDKDLPKINSQRRTLTQPDIWIVPQLDKASVLFVTAESRHDEPNSCYNCGKYFASSETCGIIGPHIRIRKFIYGEPYLPVEYWPVCGSHEYGEPSKGDASYSAENDPDFIGLCWINAPKVGQRYGGANCGGSNGGDDCDFWMIDGKKGPDKRDYEEAFCQVLQGPTAKGDCCAAWTDDDILSWQLAQNILRSGQAKGIEDQSDPSLRIGLKQLKPRER